MKLPNTRNVGSVWPHLGAPVGVNAVDAALFALFNDRVAMRQMLGVVLSPLDSIASAIASCADGDTIVLLPGTYSVSTTVAVNKRVTLLGINAWVYGAGLLMDLTADAARVQGLGFYRTDRVTVGTDGAALRLTGAGCVAQQCVVQTAGPRGIQVDGLYCSVQGTQALAASGRVAGDSDVYWSDGATNGTACGNIWSRTAGTFVLDYRGIDLMSEAANGDVAILNVR